MNPWTIAKPVKSAIFETSIMRFLTFQFSTWFQSKSGTWPPFGQKPVLTGRSLGKPCPFRPALLHSEVKKESGNARIRTIEFQVDSSRAGGPPSNRVGKAARASALRFPPPPPRPNELGKSGASCGPGRASEVSVVPSGAMGGGCGLGGEGEAICWRLDMRGRQLKKRPLTLRQTGGGG